VIGIFFVKSNNIWFRKFEYTEQNEFDRVYLLGAQYARHEKPLGVKAKNFSHVSVQ
jgi:hypothetical protein